MNRIKALDGLRTIAVLGVLWTHVWMFFDNIPWKIGPIDINRVISIGRNGVDLFFVISGFCMYLMYHKKAADINLENYTSFLVKRWRRIAPAFYVLIALESILFFVRSNYFPTIDFFAHLTFNSIFLTRNEFSPHYWSLATEWQFYLVLPLIFIKTRTKSTILRNTFLVMLCCMIFRLGLFYFHQNELMNKITVMSEPIWYRFVEFGMGIWAAVLYLRNYKLPELLCGFKGFSIACIVAYCGRIFMLTEFVSLFGNFAFVFASLAEPLMAFGFGLILYNVITTESVISKLLSSAVFLFIGRISYSFYLWHWVIAYFVSTSVISRYGTSLSIFNLSFVLSLILTIPVSMLSYKLLEAPYFKKTTPGSPELILKEVTNP